MTPQPQKTVTPSAPASKTSSTPSGRDASNELLAATQSQRDLAQQYIESNVQKVLTSQGLSAEHMHLTEKQSTPADLQNRLDALSGNVFEKLKYDSDKQADESAKATDPKNENPAAPKTIASKIDVEKTKFKTNDGKEVPINRIALNDLNRMERVLLNLIPSSFNPIQVLSEGTNGTTIVIKDWENFELKLRGGKKFKDMLTPELLAQYNFKISSTDDKKHTITLSYDLDALTDPKRAGKLVDLTTRRLGGIANPFDYSESVKVFPAVERNFKDMFSHLDWEPAIVSPEKVGLKTDPRTVVVADPDGGYMKNFKKEYFKQAYEYGFIPEAHTHNGKHYIKLKFSPIELSKMDDKGKIEKFVAPAKKGMEQPTNRYQGWNGTSVELDAEFEQRFSGYLDDRVGGWQKNVGFRRKWEVSSNSPTSVTMKGVAAEDVKNLTKNPHEAAKDGITVSATGSTVTFKFDKSKIKDQQELVTFKGSDGWVGELSASGLFSSWSEEIKVTPKTLLAVKSLVREMRAIGDLSNSDNLEFDRIKLINFGLPNKVGFEDGNGVYEKIFASDSSLAQRHGFTAEKQKEKRNGKTFYIMTYTGK